jgi:hypothetical protein
MNKLIHLEGNIYQATFTKEVDVDRIQRNLLDIADNGLVTFGHINTEILPFINVERNDLCLFDDQTLDLAMPNTWYLNKGTNALSISTYYNFLNYKEMAKAGKLFTKNAQIANQYGRIAMIELYWQSEVEEFFVNNDIPYFGTPKTLTECMRVLEGWNLQITPRLYSYISFANVIHGWCKENFAGYKEELWSKSREENEIILAEHGITNIREGVREYWKQVLLNKQPKVNPGDVEIDVLSYRFYENRQPAIILIGEDIFSETPTPEKIMFRRFSSSETIYSYRLYKKSNKPLLNAQLAQKHFPNSKIILLETESGLPNFSMCKLDEIKQGVSLEVGQIAQLLSELQFNFET